VKIQLSWLREFVDVPGSPESVAQTMSVRGFAVEGIETIDIGDAMLDFEVTANRPDCLSLIGMAREVATAYGLPLRAAGRPAAGPALRVDSRAGAAVGGPAESVRGAGAAVGRPADIDIAIEEPDLCPRYVGAVADVSVKPSPLWMQTRLHAAGVRPINNIVDVTNYVLLELGQPMHAFDFGALAGAQIRVRNAKPGEQLRTLDGQSRALSPDVLVIADAERAAAIAGVMGGADSEVTNATTTIVLESAYFDPRSVRRTSKKLGLRTEASMRFERGADPGAPLVAMARAMALLDTIGAGRGRGAAVDCHPKRRDSLHLHLRRARIAGLLGAALPNSDIRRILDGLGFMLHDVADGWDVDVPTRRVDVVREVDLIEELARHYGFDRLPVTFPALTTAPRPIDPRIVQTRHLRAILTAQGFHEAVTFGFMAHAAAARFAPQADIVSIANPLSENFAVLRPSALPGLIDAMAHNRHREQRDIRLFEIGARFSRTAGERRAVACVWTGTAAPEHWAGGARDVDLFDMKGVVERVCEAVGVSIDSTAACREPWLAPDRSAEVQVNGTRVGLVGQLAADVADAHDLPADPVYVAEIDLDAIEHLGRSHELRVEPLPRYPSVTRDISVLLDDTLAAADVRSTIRRAGPDTLVRVIEFDRYQGKGVPDHKVSLSLRLTFRSADRTLTDSEVQIAMEHVLSALTTQHGAVQR
jgi:phenylalanyl-tRNA synthetase beta chain